MSSKTLGYSAYQIGQKVQYQFGVMSKKFNLILHKFLCFRPSPTRLNSTTLPRNYLGSDQLYPDDFAYPNHGAGGGYFNPLEAMTSSPLRSR